MKSEIPVSARQRKRIFLLNMVRWRRIRNKKIGISAGCDCVRMASKFGCFVSLTMRKVK